MDRLKVKFKMGQKKSKQSTNPQNSVDNKAPTNRKHSNDLASGGGSPPRGLKDILASEQKTKEFHSYLTSIDQENEDTVMVLRLDFALACRKMSKMLSGQTSIPLSQPVTVNGRTAGRFGGSSGTQTWSDSSDVTLVDVVGVKVTNDELIRNTIFCYFFKMQII